MTVLVFNFTAFPPKHDYMGFKYEYIGPKYNFICPKYNVYAQNIAVFET